MNTIKQIWLILNHYQGIRFQFLMKLRMRLSDQFFSDVKGMKTIAYNEARSEIERVMDELA